MRKASKTSIYLEVEAAHDYAVTMRRASFITGPAGIGKTTALLHIADAKGSKARYIRMDAPRATMKASLAYIADALSFLIQRESASQIWDYLTSNFGHHDFDHSLLFDEAQNIPLDLLKEIVDLPERFGIPVVICANPEFLRRKRVAAVSFEQIESRLAKRVTLTRPTRGDFETIAVDFDVFGKDAHEACTAYGSRTSIRDLVAMLEHARRIAGSGPLRLQEIKGAVVYKSGGTHALKLLSSAA